MAKRKNDIEINAPQPKPYLKFRYFCPACTGRALYSDRIHEFPQVQCQNCQAISGYDANNWFEVTDQDELRKINS